jgi:hypothetical protein
MNTNKMTQFNPGDMARYPTMLDQLRGERNVNGGRNIMQQILFNAISDGNPLLTPIVNTVRDPNLLRKILGDNVIDVLESLIPPKKMEMGQFDLSKNTDLQRKFIDSRNYYFPFTPTDSLKK